MATCASGSSSFSCLGRTRLVWAENVLLVTWDLDNLVHGGLPNHLPAASSAWPSWVGCSSLMVGNEWERVLPRSHVALSHALPSLCLSAIDFFLAANWATGMCMCLRWWVCSSSPVHLLCRHTCICTLVSLGACADLWSLQYPSLRPWVSSP